MRWHPDVLVASLIPFLILFHLYCAPYTKVEESFNLQATHDILSYGIPKQNVSQILSLQYDHFAFPGAVPRTFVGALLLAGISKPIIWLTGVIDKQFLVRGILGLFNAFAILSFRNAVARSFGNTAANWYILLQASQFHVIYYASRTLPNMLAFGPSTLALLNLLPLSMGMSASTANSKRYRLSIYLLTLAGVIFRSELAVLLAAQISYLILRKQVTLTREILPAGIGGGLVGLLITVPLDSYFWQSVPLWPEFVGFYYNAIEGKSSQWGISPWHFYFTNAVPRLLMNPITWQLCIPLAVGMETTRRASLDILVPLAMYVGIYSLQPHKEWRFIVYVVPGLTAVASIGANWIWTRRAKSNVYRFFAIVLVASTLGSFMASLGMLVISRLNYPGAEALSQLHGLADGSDNVIRVHLDTLSCTTGITRFLQKSPHLTPTRKAPTLWLYDKTEDSQRLLTPAFWEGFDFVLAEKPEKVIGRWEITNIINGFSGFAMIKPGEGNVDERLTIASASRSSSTREEDRSRLLDLLQSVEGLIRSKITGGWWVGVRMEPKIRIMKRLTGPINISP